MTADGDKLINVTLVEQFIIVSNDDVRTPGKEPRTGPHDPTAIDNHNGSIPKPFILPEGVRIGRPLIVQGKMAFTEQPRFHCGAFFQGLRCVQ